MDKVQFLDILSKYIDGQSSSEEEAFLYAYYKLFMAEPDVTKLLNDHEKEKLKLDIKAGVDLRLNRTAGRKVKITKLWTKLTAAAAILLITGLGIYLFNTRNKPLINSGSSYANDINPGTKGATLTLSNGKKIRITDANHGELAKEAGVTITKTADGQVLYTLSSREQMSEGQKEEKYNTLSTAKGETYIVTLPDKSKVWLNAFSSITYPTNLNELKERKIKLKGEAYFEVAKNAAKPFRVMSEKQTIEVLGTHFNVNTYSEEEDVKTTLLEGSVKVLSDGDEILLKPGQQSAIANRPVPGHSSTIRINTVNIEEVLAWKNGWFQFEDADIKTVMNQIGRWYNVDIIYQGKIPEDHYKGKVSKNVKVSKVLEILDASGINFKIEGKTIIVK